VVEEVVVQKDTTERTETVKESVRRQDVDIKQAS
jgi:stress response protein YsnF